MKSNFVFTKWNLAMLVTGNEPASYCDFETAALTATFIDKNLTLAANVRVPDNYDVNYLVELMHTIKISARSKL